MKSRNDQPVRRDRAVDTCAAYWKAAGGRTVDERNRAVRLWECIAGQPYMTVVTVARGLPAPALARMLVRIARHSAGHDTRTDLRRAFRGAIMLARREAFAPGSVVPCVKDATMVATLGTGPSRARDARAVRAALPSRTSVAELHYAYAYRDRGPRHPACAATRPKPQLDLFDRAPKEEISARPAADRIRRH